MDHALRPAARLGDVWVLGRHRLACGDAGDPLAVARAIGQNRPVLLFTSPPYGNQRDYSTGGIPDWDRLMQEVFSATALPTDAQILVNLGLIHRRSEWQPYWSHWLEWMRARGWRQFGLYVWDQGPGLPGRFHGRLAPSFELIFHFNRVTRSPRKIVPCKSAGRVKTNHGGLRSPDGTIQAWSHHGRPVQSHKIPDSVIRITRHKARGIETQHPAVFPRELPAFIMRVWSDPGQAVYDPFVGSGTSIIAAEQTGRISVGVELNPAYVDIAIQRWEALTGRRAERIDDG